MSGALFPQHINYGAYEALRDECFPLELPFDLWRTEARGLLRLLPVNDDVAGVTLHQLWETHWAATDGVAAEHALLHEEAWADPLICAEVLGLAHGQYRKITGADECSSLEIWDRPTGSTDPWTEAQFHARTGLTSAELTTLGELDALALGSDAETRLRLSRWSSNPGECDSTQIELRLKSVADANTPTAGDPVSDDMRDLIHRFLRLWRCLNQPTHGRAPWSLEDLEQAIRGVDDQDASEYQALNRKLDAILGHPTERRHGWSVQELDRAIRCTETRNDAGLYPLGDELIIGLAHVARLEDELGVPAQRPTDVVDGHS